MITRLKHMVQVMLVIALTTVIISGCGKKAPPVAPSRQPLVGVSDLQGSLSQGNVRLTWNHSSENLRAVGYIVLRAQSSLSKPDCPDCPMVFQRVETISLTRSMRKQSHVLEFNQDVADGFRYTFNVRPYQSSGAQGPDSNFFVIAFPEE